RVNGTLKNRTPGPKFIKIGRAIRYLKEDLDIWLDLHRKP
ncbi:TPA: DNA-binding protein, partial [Legionella pneumophila subsp. pneumophila]|nr:DNA-binding protein [Legionella pneumophila subsp. pneumophila]